MKRKHLLCREPRQLTVLMHVNAYCWINKWRNSLSGSMINALLIDKLTVRLHLVTVRLGGSWLGNAALGRVNDLWKFKYCIMIY